MSSDSYLVTYMGDGVVNLGKAGTFGKGTSAYVSEAVAHDLSKDKSWQVVAPGGHAPKAAPAPAAAKAAEKHEPAKAEKKAEEKKPAEKPKDEKKAEEPKKAEATAE